MTPESLDALIITPPFSPFDAGPPLGPAVLKAYGANAGYSVVTIDLNIHFLRQFRSGYVSDSRIVGDHAKDQTRIKAARENFEARLLLSKPEASLIPCCTPPILGLQHSFEEIDHALNLMNGDTFWSRFFTQHVFDKHQQPRVLGVSLMGPAQVLPALFLATMSKERWPETLVIAGGSHVTLLQEDIRSEQRYAHDVVDLFLPGHCEEVFTRLLCQVKAGRDPAILGTIRAGQAGFPLIIQPICKLAPMFERDELYLYDQMRFSLPIQFSKGCSYGRCTMCTYPTVEPYEKYRPEAIATLLMPLLDNYKAKRISIKDSLIPLSMLQAVGRFIKQRSSVVTWSATTKLTGGMNSRTMKELYDHGCRTLELGIETIHPNMQGVLDKRQPLELVEQALEAAIKAGIAIVLNMLYGLPGETEDQAHQQLDWYLRWHQSAPNLVYGSHNMLEINRGAPMSINPHRFGIQRGDIGPWAFSYRWNAPHWRPAFARYLHRALGEIEQVCK